MDLISFLWIIGIEALSPQHEDNIFGIMIYFTKSLWFNQKGYIITRQDTKVYKLKKVLYNLKYASKA